MAKAPSEFELADGQDIIFSRYGNFYTADGEYLTEGDARRIIYNEYYPLHLSSSKLDNVLSEIKKIKHFPQDKLPAFKYPTAPEKETNIEFPLQAYQILKYILTHPASAKRYIFMVMSEGNTGKSTFSNFLRCLYKDEYVSEDFTKWKDNRFATSTLTHARLIVFNDCEGGFIDEVGIIKQITGGDMIRVEGKNAQTCNCRIDAHMLFFGNEKPKYNVLDSGLEARMINIPWETVSFKKDPKWVTYEYSPEELAYHINIALALPDMPFEKYRRNTMRTALSQNPAFLYHKYTDYKNALGKLAYNEDKFNRFHALIDEYYTPFDGDSYYTVLEKINAKKDKIWMHEDFHAKE